jgi:exodeoxyribonuclease V alpha subunit
MTTKYIKSLLSIGRLLRCNEIYHEIYEIVKVKPEYYEIRRIDDITTNASKIIRHFDSEIRSIPIKDEKNIRKLNEFRKKYNKQIEYLNNYKRGHLSTRYMNLGFEEILNLHNLKSGITIRHLNEIMFYLKKTLDYDLQISYLLENPFNFIREEKQLISYLVAEKICNELNIEISFSEKCKKWSFYHIVHTYNSFYADPDKFYESFKKLCIKNNKKYNDYIKIINSVIITKYIDGKPYITTNYLYNYEKKLTIKFIDLFLNKKTTISPEIVTELITKFEENESKIYKKPYALDEEQKKAIENALINSLSVITGFPGTGKSSIVKCILFIISLINSEDIQECNEFSDDSSVEDSKEYSLVDSDEDIDEESDEDIEKLSNKLQFVNSQVSIMTPTGLAYVNIKKKCSYIQDGKEILLFNHKISGTCHKTLYNIFYSNIQKLNKQQHISSDDDEEDEIIYNPKYIFVDEFSMMDIFMFKELIDYCQHFGCNLILVGDNNQLPSIGPGCILHNIILSNNDYELFNIDKLTKIKRQDSGALLRNIIKMTKTGLKSDDFIDETMQFFDINYFLNDNNLIKQSEFIDFINLHNLNPQNSKVLSYFNGENDKSRNHPTNVIDLNILLQKTFNNSGTPLEKGLYQNFIFKVGDIIVRTENEISEKGFRANGEQAIIKNFDSEFVYLEYLDSNSEDKISLDRFYNEFKLAYALTVHKSQGSQYKNIVIFIESDSYVWDRPALYTAISRAEEKCFIIADYEEFLKVQKKIQNSIKPSLFLKELDSIYDIN